MNKIQKIKEIVRKIDVIPYWNENPTSKTLKGVIKKQREVLENNNEEEILKATYKLKHRIWVLINKTPYLTDEDEN